MPSLLQSPLAVVNVGLTRFAETIEWYRANREWWEPLVPEAERIYVDNRG